MTKQQFKAKVKELKKSANQLIDDKAEKLLRSGAVDLESWPNDFQLPKCFMSAMGNEIEEQFRPLDKILRKEAENIKHFI